MSAPNVMPRLTHAPRITSACVGFDDRDLSTCDDCGARYPAQAGYWQPSHMTRRRNVCTLCPDYDNS